MKNVLEVKNLIKRFGDFTAVNDISFELKEGEILGLLGPNGAGKTTTIQMLLGVLKNTQGQIKFFGKNFKEHREEILEKVNFSSTYTNLPWDLHVGEVLKYSAYLYDIKDRAKRIEKFKKIFRLERLWNEKVSALSAGQLTRLNLAKAFLNYPKVLLLDEPTASLDPDVAKFIRDFLVEERKNFKVSIIITSHNMAEVQEICDRVIFINQGKIIADDTPENLAKSIKVSHLEFFLKDGMKRAVEYCQQAGIKCKNKGRYLSIDIEEKKIAKLLDDLKEKGIVYDEISIQKPTLEDYFLEVIAKK